MFLFDRTRCAEKCPAFLSTRKDARISRLNSQVLWLAPSAAAALIERANWEFVRARCPNLPAFDALPPTRRRDVAAAWLAEVPPPHCFSDLDALMSTLREKLIACESLDPADALQVIGRLTVWLAQAPDEPLGGRLDSAEQAHAEVLTLYLDTRPTLDWPAIAAITEDNSAGESLDSTSSRLCAPPYQGHTFAFGTGVVFTPQPIAATYVTKDTAWRIPAPRQLTFSFFNH